MNILFDNEIFSRQRYGGISRYFYELISWLAKKKSVTIDVFLGINNTGYDFDTVSGNFKVNSRRLPIANKLHMALHPLNKYNFEKYSINSDFNLFHKTYYSDSGLNFKIPIVSTIHDMTHELLPQYFAKADNTSYLKKLSIESSDGIVCVSETTKNDLIEIYNYDKTRIKVIYHGNTIKDNPEAKRIIKEPYILYVGQRWGYKNFNILLKAYSASIELQNNFKLVCFGGGDFNYSEKIIIKETGLQGSVIYISGNDNALISMYKYAELLVYTSFYEGFGFPPVEAMECGCPVLTSPAGSVKEISGDAALYFDPESEDDLTNRIFELLNDSVLKKSLVTKGNMKASQFSWEKSSEEHLEFYKEIINL